MSLTFITDRTNIDVTEATNNQASTENNKGAWNYTDLNRIENNYKSIIEGDIRQAGYWIEHKYRNYTETVRTATGNVTTTYTNWNENNIPYKSEIDRIRQNCNNLLQQFLNNAFYNQIAYSNYVDYVEANTLEKIEATSAEMMLKLKQSYKICGTLNCGGDLL